jgi:hypothetical protein
MLASDRRRELRDKPDVATLAGDRRREFRDTPDVED